MKIYLAGRYHRREELLKLSEDYIKDGHEITSKWLAGAEEGMTYTDIATMDLEDVERADALVLYSEPYGEPIPGGGRHVEFGYAIGRKKKVFIVGPLENVFHWTPGVIVFPKTESLVRHLHGKVN